MAYAYQRGSAGILDDLATFARGSNGAILTLRQRFTTAISWDIPIGKGCAYLNSIPKGVDYIVGGWTLTTDPYLFGRPLFFNQNLIVTGSPKISGNPNRGSTPTARPTHVYGSSAAMNLHKLITYSDSTDPESGSDMTMNKSFKLTERFRLEARLEAYNLFNRLQLANPTVDFTSANFGKITTKLVAYNGREIQYGLRLVF